MESKVGELFPVAGALGGDAATEVTCAEKSAESDLKTVTIAAAQRFATLSDTKQAEIEARIGKGVISRNVIYSFNLEGESYELFNMGSYSYVYKSKSGRFVIKVPIDSVGDVGCDNEKDLNYPLRHQRLHKEINPGLEVRVYSCAWPIMDWPRDRVKNVPILQMPFFDNSELPGDEKMVDETIAIYERTGRIILDAGVPGNFLHRPRKVFSFTKHTVCVDLDVALKRSRSGRPASPASVELESVSLSGEAYPFFWNDMSARGGRYPRPKTAVTIKALLYLDWYPEVERRLLLGHLKKSEAVREVMARSYDRLRARFNERHPCDGEVQAHLRAGTDILAEAHYSVAVPKAASAASAARATQDGHQLSDVVDFGGDEQKQSLLDPRQHLPKDSKCKRLCSCFGMFKPRKRVLDDAHAAPGDLSYQ